MFRVQQTINNRFPSSSMNANSQNKNAVVELYQKDFENGPYVITQSGKYILMEDIVFDPFPNKFEDIFDSLASFPDFNHNFVLGYFAAIIIYGTNIELNLGGHTLRQSFLHNHQQRFFSLIELADRPFMPGQGPANFGTPLSGCTNVMIHNGVLGLSSHHGIHGNNPTNINIQNLVIYDYEVAGISINGGNHVNISNVEIRQNYKNILVNGLFSNAIFTVKKLMIKEQQEPTAVVQTYMGAIGITQIKDRLKQSVIDAYTDIVNDVDVGTTNPDSKFYFNPSKLTDGNCYGISFNSQGLLVNEYKKEFEKGSNNITLVNVSISDIDCKPTEVLAIVNTPYNHLGDNPQTLNTVNKGPFGDVINYWKAVNDEGQFTVENNPLILAQILTGTVCRQLLEWIETGSKDFKARLSTVSILNNLDIMAHVMKGTIGLFLSSVENVTCKIIKINSIHNQSDVGNDEYTQTGHNYIGGRTCGVLVASSQNVRFEDITIHDIISKNSEAYGYYLYGKCKQLVFPIHYGNVGSIKTGSENYKNKPKYTKSIVKTIAYDDTYEVV